MPPASSPSTEAKLIADVLMNASPAAYEALRGTLIKEHGEKAFLAFLEEALFSILQFPRVTITGY